MRTEALTEVVLSGWILEILNPGNLRFSPVQGDSV